MLLLFLHIAAQAASIPSFDTKAYCRKIADTIGGSYQIEETCRNEEYDALEKLNSRVIPDRILKYCTRIGETIGGSYQIMETCVEEETEAANRLR